MSAHYDGTTIEDHRMKARRIATIEKALRDGKTPTPQKDYGYFQLYHFAIKEMRELDSELAKLDSMEKRGEHRAKIKTIQMEKAMFEIADVLNVLEFIYKKIMGDMKPYQTIFKDISNGLNGNLSVTTVRLAELSRKTLTGERGSSVTDTTDT